MFKSVITTVLAVSLALPAASLAQSSSTTTTTSTRPGGGAPTSESRTRQTSAPRAPDEPGRAEASDVQTSARGERAQENKLSDRDIATAPIREIAKSTRHTANIGGKTVPYSATAGTLTIRDDDGKPTASMFYVAYTAEGRGSNRPVTFLYNGGPGSSSMWLHMGSVGPVRVFTDSPGMTRNPPFHYGNNEDSLLDKSDLVFVDAIGAGYSRPLGDTKLEKFWGTDPDIDAFARGIERYLTINQRWNAPKFIFGESYGTTRSAGLSYRLQQDGVQLNGVILLSSILNYGRRDPGFDVETVNYIPTYAATAVYHNRIPKPANLDAFLKEVRDWARGPYLHALSLAHDLPEAERQAVAQKLASYTGLSVQYILNSDLRVDPNRYRRELLRDQRRTLGRYDSRFTGIEMDAAGESQSYDPSDTGITGAFVGTFHDYLSKDLGFESELSYRPTFYGGGPQWSFTHRAPGSRGGFGSNNAAVILDLGAAMRENPGLKVYSLNGIYDMATPFFGTEYDLAHMQLDPTLRPNVRFAYYPSGHMVYLNAQALKEMKADLGRFYDEATKQ